MPGILTDRASIASIFNLRLLSSQRKQAVDPPKRYATLDSVKLVKKALFDNPSRKTPEGHEDRWIINPAEQAHAVSEQKQSPEEHIPGYLKNMQIEKRKSWILPAGFHQAKIVDARLLQRAFKGKDEEVLRFLFEITSLLHPTKTYVAQKVYRAVDSKFAIEDLEHLLKGKAEQVLNLAGEIIPEALSLFVGMEVDIEIEHHRGKNHDEPYCIVTQVKSRGVLIDLMDEAA